MVADVGTVGANVTTFTHANLTPSTEYRYRVRSFNDVSSYWFYTNIATAMTQAVASTPVAPSNLTATTGDYVTTLTWQDNSSTEDKFVLQHLSYNNWNTVKEIPANQTTTYAFLDSAADNHFRVIARSNTSGDSPPSRAHVQKWNARPIGRKKLPSGSGEVSASVRPRPRTWSRNR